MKLTNLKVNNFFNTNGKFTFLVGAGCSIDSPSCLPAGYGMMEAIIDHTCHKSERKGILELMKSGQLRFETLVEIIRDQLDKKLMLIDYYGICDKPNIQHFFLAEMIKKGHFAMTTNFDYLIEYALNQSGVPIEEIIPVITKEDFEVFADPYEQLNRGKKTVYKVHGSPKNIITRKHTKDSLIATIQAFGSNKEGENVFQLESFKQPLFENITKERSLAIIGYSGSDDFDIVPTLKVLKQIQNVIWINYSHDIELGKEQIYEINEHTSQSLNNLDLNLRKIVQILFEIWEMKNTDHVYLLNVNTKKLAEGLIESNPNISSENFSLQPKDYLNNIYPEVNDIIKYYIPYKIYIDKDLYDNALPCLKKLKQVAEDTGDTKWKAIALANIGNLFTSQGKYTDALKTLEEAKKIAQDIGGTTSYKEILNLKASIYNNMAIVYERKKDYPGALNLYKDAARIQRQYGNLNGTIINLNNVAEIYRIQERFPESLTYYEEALKIAEQLGNIRLKSSILNNSGLVYASQKNYSEALKRYEEALKISEQLGDRSLNLRCLHNIGTMKQSQGKYQEASKLFNEALRIAELIGDIETKDIILNYIRLNSEKKSVKQGMGIETKLYQEIRKIKEVIICHPKWNTIQIKNFIKGFIEKIFNAFRDNLNWQRIETICNELEPNLFSISSGSPIKGTIQIIERDKKKNFIQIEWEEHSETAKSMWEGIIKQFREIFSKPVPKSLK